MSATRSPKVSERVAPKAADPQPPKKKHDDDDGPTFAMLFHAWVEAHRASLLDSLKRLGKQPIGSFFTCLVMAVALSLPMGLSLLLNNVERLGGSWQRAAQISLYLQMDASSEQGENLSDQIKGMAGVADAEFISREKALIKAARSICSIKISFPGVQTCSTPAWRSWTACNTNTPYVPPTPPNSACSHLL